LPNKVEGEAEVLAAAVQVHEVEVAVGVVEEVEINGEGAAEVVVEVAILHQALAEVGVAVVTGVEGKDRPSRGTGAAAIAVGAEVEVKAEVEIDTKDTVKSEQEATVAVEVEAGSEKIEVEAGVLMKITQKRRLQKVFILVVPPKLPKLKIDQKKYKKQRYNQKPKKTQRKKWLKPNMTKNMIQNK
jgi:hypothetical protein